MLFSSSSFFSYFNKFKIFNNFIFSKKLQFYILIYFKNILEKLNKIINTKFVAF